MLQDLFYAVGGVLALIGSAYLWGYFNQKGRMIAQREEIQEVFKKQQKLLQEQEITETPEKPKGEILKTPTSNELQKKEGKNG